MKNTPLGFACTTTHPSSHFYHSREGGSEECKNNKREEEKEETESVEDKGRGNERGEHAPSLQAP